MKVWLIEFYSGPSAVTCDPAVRLLVTNDNANHLWNTLLFQASAAEVKEITFDLKEIMGETTINIPWEQAGFLTEGLNAPLEVGVKLNIYEYEITTDTSKLMFRGFANAFKANKGMLEISCISFVEMARDNFPRMVLSRHCNHRVYSDLCGANAENFTQEGTILDITYDRQGLQIGVGTGPADRAYAYGYIRKYIDTGVGYYQYRYITGDTAVASNLHNIDLLHPAPANWQVNDSILMTYGCTKTIPVCKSRFNNFEHFLGFPYAPYESIRFTGLRASEQHTMVDGGSKK